MLVACGDDAGSDADGGTGGGAGSGASGESGHAGSGSAGHAGSAGHGASGSGGSAGDGAGACTATSTDVTGEQTDLISNLSVAGDTLVFLSTDPTLAVAPKIEAIKVDGSDRRTLYTSTGDRRVRSVIALGDDVYFLETDEEVVATYEVWHVSLTGGDAARLGTDGFANGDLFGADAGHVYVMSIVDQPVGAVFSRVDTSSGVIEKAATVPDTGTPFHVTLSGDDVFFIAGFAGSRASEPKQVYGFKKTAANATPDTLWVVEDNDICFLSLGGLIATPTKLACGYSGVATHKRDGSAEMTLLPNDLTAPTHVLVATDAENLYLMERVGPTEAPKHLNRLPSGGGELVPVVCDQGEIGNKLSDGTFPRQNEYEVVVGDSSLFWVEQRFDGTDNHYLLRSAPK